MTLWSRQDIVICYECLDYLNGRKAKQIAIHGGLKPLAGYDPVFSVLDVERAVDHYQRLGFTTDYHDETYAFAHWGDLVIHLAHDDNPEAHMTAVLYIHVDDVDELAADWREAGMQVTGPRNEDYGSVRATTSTRTATSSDSGVHHRMLTPPPSRRSEPPICTTGRAEPGQSRRDRAGRTIVKPGAPYFRIPLAQRAPSRVFTCPREGSGDRRMPRSAMSAAMTTTVCSQAIPSPHHQACDAVVDAA